MTDSASEASSKDPPFVENDAHRTWLPYDRGGIPILIALIWAVFIITYIVVMSVLALPDLRAWLAH
jgi:hypothetical protein